jgi:hypothetical protein
MALTCTQLLSSRSNSVWDPMADATRRRKTDVGGFQSHTDAGASMLPPKGDIGVLPLSADLQLSVSKDGAAGF